jgi:transposase-like protein
MSLGIKGLITTSQNVSYSKALKESAVSEYLSGLGSLIDICQKYGIHSKEQLRNWILKYKGHEKLKTSGTVIMAKGRKTTYDERVEIVTSCIENEMNYAVTAERYQVSYQQVYQWVKKTNPKVLADYWINVAGRSRKMNCLNWICCKHLHKPDVYLFP